MSSFPQITFSTFSTTMHISPSKQQPSKSRSLKRSLSLTSFRKKDKSPTSQDILSTQSNSLEDEHFVDGLFAALSTAPTQQTRPLDPQTPLSPPPAYDKTTGSHLNTSLGAHPISTLLYEQSSITPYTPTNSPYTFPPQQAHSFSAVSLSLNNAQAEQNTEMINLLAEIALELLEKNSNLLSEIDTLRKRIAICNPQSLLPITSAQQIIGYKLEIQHDNEILNERIFTLNKIKLCLAIISYIGGPIFTESMSAQIIKLFETFSNTSHQQWKNALTDAKEFLDNGVKFSLLQSLIQDQKHNILHQQRPDTPETAAMFTARIIKKIKLLNKLLEKLY